MRNHRIKLVIFTILLLLITIGTAVYCIFFRPFLSSQEHAYIYIGKKDNIEAVYLQMDKMASPVKMAAFKLVAKAIDYDQNIRSGKYEIGDGLNLIDITKNLRNKHQVPVQLVIPNIRTLQQLSARIAKVIASDSTDLMTCFRDTNICKRFNTDTANISGLFIPNTYEVYWDITPEHLLKKMHKESERFWNAERKAKAEHLDMSIAEIITLASIVDQETANNAEKPSIAGMYLNRLHKKMLLQADPTVKFALQQFGIRRIMHKHLKIDSPYNTYRYVGLPPGPIAIPAISSIDAVLNAEKNNYIYMCAKEDFSGTHNFASTYSEHLRNARKYTRALNERGIK